VALRKTKEYKKREREKRTF